ncbi:hypothetical protein AB0B40_36265 [Streptomyces sp. NPDC042638]|uniref:hypothetical protein n=1 Tax=Streptomyces sp. NPDC042638 TaxID=3154333 RepID=UPI0033C343BD
MEVQPGDRISADPTAYILTIDNLASPGQRRPLTKRASAARSGSAEIIVERPTVTPFGATWPRPLNVQFSYVTVDGALLASYGTLAMRGRQDDKRIVYAPSPAVTDSGGYSDFTLSSDAGETPPATPTISRTE